MAFRDLIARRYSVRAYTSQPVEPEKLALILEAGRLAPTSANKRPFQFVVVQSEEGLNKIKKTANAFGAPLILICCGDKEAAGPRKDGMSYYQVDNSIAVDHMLLQATDLGLGTLWIGWFDPAIIREEFHIPQNLDPISLLAIGYAADSPLSEEEREKRRKKIGEIFVGEDHWLK
ncbi:MAG: nitroreductase family protein [Christensenellaceae bacterium]|jgi:nitroreductase|nr:nitroreductase family protein [Christensenellaceae bacterium]